MTLLALALRMHRWAMLGFGLGGGLLGVVNGAGFYQLVGDDPAKRAAFGAQMHALSAQFTFLLQPGDRLDTVAGYLQWRNFGALSLLFTIWAISAGTGVIRAEEERGLLEHWLAEGLRRPLIVAWRSAGFAAAAALALPGCSLEAGLAGGACSQTVWTSGS